MYEPSLISVPQRITGDIMERFKGIIEDSNAIRLAEKLGFRHYGFSCTLNLIQAK